MGAHEEGYRPSPTSWVREQVETIENTGTTESVGINGMAVVLLTMRGRRSGAVLKVPLMRVEAGGDYLAVGSKGGAPQHPQWVHNLRANPDITLQDARAVRDVRAREIVDAAERALWWERAVAAFPDYAQYATRTDRVIPLFVLEPR